MSRDTLAIIFGIIIPVIWGMSAVAGVLSNNYTMFEVMLPVVLAEAGWLFGASIVLKKNGKNGNGKHDA